MKVPVDIKAVLDAINDTDEASKKPLKVIVIADETAPLDIRHLVLAEFKTDAPTAQVTFESYPEGAFLPDPSADMAVVVAGENPDTGRVVRDLQAVRVPTMVVTSMPDFVCKKATEMGYPLEEKDVISPDVVVDATTLPAGDESTQEPYPLTPESAEHVRDAMGSWVVAVFSEKRLAFAAAFPFVRRPLSMESVYATSIQNAGIGFVFLIPGADMPLMTLNQCKMMLQIAAAYGQTLDFGRFKEVAAVCFGGLGCRYVARSAIKLVPVAGSIIRAGVGYAGTYGMGRVLIEYFENAGDVVKMGKGLASQAQGVADDFVVVEDISIKEKAKRAARSASTAVTGAVAAAKNQMVPTVVSVVGAAADAAGLTPEDVNTFARTVADKAYEKADFVRNKGAKAEGEA